MNPSRHHPSLWLQTGLVLLMLSRSAAAASLVPADEAPQSGVPAHVNRQADAAPDDVELAALYYYAQQGQRDRVEREVERISLKFPGFVAPGDLFRPADEKTIDESTLWQLYEQDDYAGIEREISRLAVDNQGWEPSMDFQQKLARRKQRVEMTRAVEANNWSTVIALGKDCDPRTEPDVDLLWMLIDAYSSNGLLDQAIPVYQGILFRAEPNRFEDDIVMATLQKAVQVFPAAELRQVIRVLSVSPGLAPRMQELELDLMRRELADHAAGLAGAIEPTPATLAAVRSAADRAGDTKDQLLLGWYYLKMDQDKEAGTWFARALSTDPTAEALKGLVLTHMHADRKEDAFRLVTEHLDVAATDWDSFLDAVSLPFSADTGMAISPDVAKAYADAIQSSQSPAHAELLGWYAYNSRQFDAADAWFRSSFEWKPAAGSLKGAALTAIQRKDRRRLTELKAQYEAAYPQVFAELKTAVAPAGTSGQSVSGPSSESLPRYARSLKAKRYGECLSDLEKLANQNPLSADAELARGWCSLSLERLTDARNAFETALRGGGGRGDDAAYGLGLTLLRARLTDDAQLLLARERFTPARERELQAEILWQKAATAFGQKRYAEVLAALDARLLNTPETVGMSQMRAWAHYHLGNLRQSRSIFAALNQVVQDPANNRGIAAINERMGITK